MTTRLCSHKTHFGTSEGGAGGEFGEIKNQWRQGVSRPLDVKCGTGDRCLAVIFRAASHR